MEISRINQLCDQYDRLHHEYRTEYISKIKNDLDKIDMIKNCERETNVIRQIIEGLEREKRKHIEQINILNEKIQRRGNDIRIINLKKEDIIFHPIYYDPDKL